MTPAEGNANLLGAVFTPTTNWAAHSAARQEALQLGEILNQHAAQKNAETSAAAADTEAFLATARATPFMGRDKQKLMAHINAEQKALEKKLVEDYGGNIRLFAKSELPAWKAAASQRLLSQPWYQQASENTRNVVAAQEARNKNEFLVGNGDLTNFKSGEAELSDFLAGKSDGYSFRGGYKPEDDLKHFRETYAPGKLPWERVQVGEDEKLAHLVDVYGKEMGVDKFLRQHRNVPIFYRQEPLTKAVEFAQNQGRYQMAINADQRSANADRRSAAAFQTGEQLKRQHMTLNGLEIQKKSAELSGKTASGVGYDYQKFAAGATDQMRLKTPQGQTVTLVGSPQFGGSTDVLLQQMGLSKTKRKEGDKIVDTYSRGNITQGYTFQNGLNPIDLSKSQFTVENVDPKVFINANQIDAKNQRFVGPVNGLVRATIRFNSVRDAEKSGLYDPNRLLNGTGATSMFDSETKLGAGVYDPETMTATLLLPAGYVDQQSNPNYINADIKANQGQKEANQSWGMPLPYNTNFTTTP